MSAKGSGWVVKRPDGSVVQGAPMPTKKLAVEVASNYDDPLEDATEEAQYHMIGRVIDQARRAGYQIVRGEVVEVPDA